MILFEGKQPPGKIAPDSSVTIQLMVIDSPRESKISLQTKVQYEVLKMVINTHCALLHKILTIFKLPRNFYIADTWNFILCLKQRNPDYIRKIFFLFP